jgi:hypothetical protein
LRRCDVEQRTGRPRTYPWDDWIGRGKFTLVEGRDYLCRSDIMAQQIRNRMSDLGLPVTILPTGTGLAVVIHRGTVASGG